MVVRRWHRDMVYDMGATNTGYDYGVMPQVVEPVFVYTVLHCSLQCSIRWSAHALRGSGQSPLPCYAALTCLLVVIGLVTLLPCTSVTGCR